MNNVFQSLGLHNNLSHTNVLLYPKTVCRKKFHLKDIFSIANYKENLIKILCWFCLYEFLIFFLTELRDMVITAIGNLQHEAQKENPTHNTLFSLTRDIIPFLEQHWEALTTASRRSTQTWHTTVVWNQLKRIFSKFACTFLRFLYLEVSNAKS